MRIHIALIYKNNSIIILLLTQIVPGNAYQETSIKTKSVKVSECVELMHVESEQKCLIIFLFVSFLEETEIRFSCVNWIVFNFY